MILPILHFQAGLAEGWAKSPPWHPFYTCPHAPFVARNIWVLPGAPEWWHEALWHMGRVSWDQQEYEDPADVQQGDLRWRLFRAADELHDKAILLFISYSWNGGRAEAVCAGGKRVRMR